MLNHTRPSLGPYAQSIVWAPYSKILNPPLNLFAVNRVFTSMSSFRFLRRFPVILTWDDKFDLVWLLVILYALYDYNIIRFGLSFSHLVFRLYPQFEKVYTVYIGPYRPILAGFQPQLEISSNPNRWNCVWFHVLHGRVSSQALFLNRFFFSESGKISQSGEQFFKTTSGVNYRPNREISPHIKSDPLIRRKCTLLGPDTDKVDVITL